MFKKITMPYNLKKLSLIALMAGLPVFTACEKDDEDVKPQHDTTFVFGDSGLSLTDSQVRASADSSQVRNVILKSDGLSLGGMGAKTLRTYFLDSKFAISSKVKGAGNLKDLAIVNKNDSLQLVSWGFTVNQK